MKQYKQIIFQVIHFILATNDYNKVKMTFLHAIQKTNKMHVKQTNL